MASIIQIKRNLGTVAVAAPTLLDGELAYAAAGFLPNGGANELVIGNTGTAELLISNQRQVELAGAQTITGNKTFAAAAKLAIGIADLKVSGGAAGDTLITDGAGNLVWGAAAQSVTGDGTTIIDNGDGTLSVDTGAIADGITIISDANSKLAVSKAVTADVEAGTANKFVDTALLKTDVLGGALSTLATTAKTVVPAINELYGAMQTLAGGITFAGTVDCATGVLTPATDAPYKPATVADIDPALAKNYFWIVTVSGSETGVTGESAIQQDWVASDGAALHVLHFGPQTVVAGQVAYDATGNTILVGPTVQDALDQAEAWMLGPIDGGTFGA
jgi:hypothetical protein